jgi:hypothetical protein
LKNCNEIRNDFRPGKMAAEWSGQSFKEDPKY